MDTQEPCKDKVRSATLFDPYSEHCMKVAEHRCGHKMDLHCVEKLLLSHVAERFSGSMCADIERTWVTDPDGSRHPEDVITVKTWLAEISSCELPTLVLK